MHYVDLDIFKINIHTCTNRQKQGSITMWLVTYMYMRLLSIFKRKQRMIFLNICYWLALFVENKP